MAKTETSANVRDIVNRFSQFEIPKPTMTVPPAEKKQASTSQHFRCEFAYTAKQADELSFNADDVIEFLEEIEDGWNKGRHLGNGRVGFYPTNFVVPKEPTKTPLIKPKQIEEEVTIRNDPKPVFRAPSLSSDPSTLSSIPQSTSSELHDKKTKEMARVRYIYKPQHTDELHLKEVDLLITIIRKDCGDAGWFEGELNGLKGFFPDNFVELVQVPSGTPSGTTFASVKHSMDKPTSKPPATNPPPPILPAKPVKQKIEQPTAATSSATAPPPQTPKSDFMALRDKMSKGLKVLAPDQVATVQIRSVDRHSTSETEHSADSPTTNGAEAGIDWNSASTTTSQLQHATKNRPRKASKTRPTSMMTPNKSLDTEEKPPTSGGLSNMSVSMFSTRMDEPSKLEAKKDPESVVGPLKPLVPSPSQKPPLSAIHGSPIHESKPPIELSNSHFNRPSVLSKSTQNLAAAAAEKPPVSRADYDALLARVAALEARLAAVEGRHH